MLRETVSLLLIHQIPSFKHKMGGSKNTKESSSALVTADATDDQSSAVSTYTLPIASSYNDRIRPPLDAVEKLRHLMVTKEGIPLPTIVVVGDQSSGKSSVLESLAGISLPRGQGICTRVPLIMRLQHTPSHVSEIFLEFSGETVKTDETSIADDIVIATDKIAGKGICISNTPLTLVVKKNGVPDLTMVDLPGITRVAIRGQPGNIYEQSKNIIMEYIRPAESIILNVISADDDFTTSESIGMSQQVDRGGERTLAVVTKADKSLEGLVEKVTADDVNIGLGYVCVRNRIGDESYEEARIAEANLFATNPFLSMIDRSMVGIPVLAQTLVRIQARIMSKCLPEIFMKINEKLSSNTEEMNRLPKTLSSVAEAITAFMSIVCSAKESLMNLLVRGEYHEFPEDCHMHCSARLVDLFNNYSAELQNCSESDPKRNFMVDEIQALDESKSIALPNFLPRSAFLAILRPKVEKIEHIPAGFIEKAWAYIDSVVIKVLMHHSDNYNQLQYSLNLAGHHLIAKMKDLSTDWVSEIMEMEKVTDYTCSSEYLSEWNMLMAQQNAFTGAIAREDSHLNIGGIGEIALGDLRRHNHGVLTQAFDLKMRMTAYWKVMLRRLVDCMALHLQHSVRKLVCMKFEKEIVKELMDAHGGSIERMLEESPSVASKREKLKTSIKLLRESKDILSGVMDMIAID